MREDARVGAGSVTQDENGTYFQEQ